MEDYLYKAVTENSTDGVVITDVRSTEKFEEPCIIYVNDAYLEMTGYTREEVIGKTPRILQGPATDREQLDKLRNAIKEERPGYAELINYKKNGETFWTSISIFPVKDEQGSCINWIGIKRDISKLKDKERRLSEALDEKQILLQEIHHRVKNNLAVMSGVVELQAFEAEDKEEERKLLNIASCIKSIATIHEGLCKSEDFSQLDVEESLKELIYQIIDLLKSDTDIDFEFKVDKVLLNINQAVPFSMIINEVVTNIVKHAFKGLTSGKVEINLKKTKDKLWLTIKDNGVGLPKYFNRPSRTTPGLQLIDTLAKQLKAEYEFSRISPGTFFKLEFEVAQIQGSSGHYLI